MMLLFGLLLVAATAGSVIAALATGDWRYGIVALVCVLALRGHR